MAAEADGAPSEAMHHAGAKRATPVLVDELYNTRALATPEQHAPLQAWLYSGGLKRAMPTERATPA